jgi:hypothetical protein
LANAIPKASKVAIAVSKKQIYVSSMNNRETKCRGQMLCRCNMISPIQQNFERIDGLADDLYNLIGGL